MMKEELNNLWTTGRGLYVLLCLLVLGIFISPLLIAEGLVSGVLIEFVFALVLITGVFATSCSTTLRVGMVLVAILAVITRVLDRINHSNFMLINVEHVLAILTLMVFAVLIIKQFLLDKTELRNRIAAAVAVYLILGVLWARLYEFVYLFNPAAFSFDEKINPFSLIYFSFVTLTTIGYGDIVPLSTLARSLVILEGVVGQLYMVILISSLVSEFSALKIKSSQE